jgi:hypothetical protein
MEGGTMNHRVPESEFRRHPWRIHEVVADFEVEDVWQLSGTEPLSAFHRVVDAMGTFDPSDSPFPARLLWSARTTLGTWFGWDDDRDGVGGRVRSLHERLPDDLRNPTTTAGYFENAPFDVLLDLPDEFAAEIANKTMHGLLHLGAIPTADGRTKVQLTVLVKPNGLLGRAYMAAIKPFRHAIIYPLMMRQLANRWHSVARVAS